MDSNARYLNTCLSSVDTNFKVNSSVAKICKPRKDCPSKRIKLENKENVTKGFCSYPNPTNLFDVLAEKKEKKLPILANQRKLVVLLKEYSTLIIIGETGSGKSTQIPQFVYSAGIQKNAKIGVTQPRRVAAVSIALRVAQELGKGHVIGDTVGYSVRFENVISEKTIIKYLTDGMLLREALTDHFLMDYSVIILDEAHERTIHTDVLFGIVKNAQKIRAEKNLMPLKIFIMSATMDVDHFSRYFNDCRAVYIEGRAYPVNVFHISKPCDDYQTSCISTFLKIHREYPPNQDVLIFLTGQEEIESCAHHIRSLSHDPLIIGPPLKVFTLYAAQSGTNQMEIFQPLPPGTRKVVISTNIAETSVTISGIKFVIDSGMCKAKTFHPTSGLEVLKVQRISQEQAWQRIGRAGRDSEGFCYRMYTKTQFESMKKITIPEIQRANLSSVVLQLLELGIDVLNFDFLDKPPVESLSAAFEQLKLLGAIDTTRILTPLGNIMSKFPLDPRLSKILLAANKYSCLDEALTVVSLLCCESILLCPPEKREEAQSARRRFKSSLGDHITLLNIYRDYTVDGRKNLRNWCFKYFINIRNILYVREVRQQLAELCKKCNLSYSSCGTNIDNLRKCLLCGLFTNIAKYHVDQQYITLDKHQVAYIHPSSTLYGQQPECVIFTDVVQTSKCYIRSLTTIEAEWLSEVVPEYVKTKNIKFDCDTTNSLC